MSQEFVFIDNPADFIGYKVHVEGWANGCVFVLRNFTEGIAVLQTPKGKRFYYTTNRLCHIRKTQDKILGTRPDYIIMDELSVDKS